MPGLATAQSCLEELPHIRLLLIVAEMSYRTPEVRGEVREEPPHPAQGEAAERNNPCPLGMWKHSKRPRGERHPCSRSHCGCEEIPLVQGRAVAAFYCSSFEDTLCSVKRTQSKMVGVKETSEGSIG